MSSRVVPGAWRARRLILSIASVAASAAMCGRALATAGLPVPNKVVVVVEENHSYSEIVGSASAPYITSLASTGANMTASYAVTHPSQPNYLALFSGSTQGVTNDSVPAGTPFSTRNLGAELIAAGRTFTGYSQTLPSVGYTGASYTTVSGQNQYVRKHNPWVNWQDSASPLPANHLPPSVNQPFTAFPSSGNFASLPTVSFVIPDERYDMHDGSISAGDTWLKNNLDAYKTWAATNNALLVLTFDEDDSSSANRITTIFWGPMVKPGNYGETINHYNVLRTIEDFYSLPTHAGAAASATPITDIWAVPEPGTAMLAFAGAGLAMLRRRRFARR